MGNPLSVRFIFAPSFQLPGSFQSEKRLNPFCPVSFPVVRTLDLRGCWAGYPGLCNAGIRWYVLVGNQALGLAQTIAHTSEFRPKTQVRAASANTRSTGSIPVGTTRRLSAPISPRANGFEFTDFLVSGSCPVGKALFSCIRLWRLFPIQSRKGRAGSNGARGTSSPGLPTRASAVANGR